MMVIVVVEQDEEGEPLFPYMDPKPEHLLLPSQDILLGLFF